MHLKLLFLLPFLLLSYLQVSVTETDVNNPENKVDEISNTLGGFAADLAGTSAEDLSLNKLRESLGVFAADLAAGTGAEDLSLNKLRESNRLYFNLVFSTLGISPHFAIGLRWYYGDIVDDVIFGENESKIKSPYSDMHFYLAPGLLGVRYIMSFFDTDPIQTSLLTIIYLLTDLEFWFELVTIFYYHDIRGGVHSFFLRIGWAIMTSLIVICCTESLFFIFSSHVSILQNVGTIIFYMALIYRVLINQTINICNYIDGALITYKYKVIIKKITDDKKKNKVVKVLETIDGTLWSTWSSWFSGDSLAPSLWSKESLSAILDSEGIQYLSKGAIGCVWSVKYKHNQKYVAVKSMQLQNVGKYKSGVEILSDWIGTIYGTIQSGNFDVVRIDEMIQFSQLIFSNKYTKSNSAMKKFVLKAATYEVKALNAVNALDINKGILKFHSAYMESFGDPSNSRDDDKLKLSRSISGSMDESTGSTINGSLVHILTELVNPLNVALLEAMNGTQRLKLVYTMFLAIAELHAGGIVHRDLKPGNIGVRIPSTEHDDNPRAVILDFGSAHLPYGADQIYNGHGTKNYYSPERLKYIPGTFSKVVGIYLSGAASDVWAAAITALDILSCRKIRAADDISKLFERKYRSGTKKDIEKLLNDYIDRHQRTYMGLSIDVISPLAGPNRKLFIDLFLGMLEVDYSKRLTMKEALAHAYWSSKLGDEYLRDAIPNDNYLSDNSDLHLMTPSGEGTSPGSKRSSSKTRRSSLSKSPRIAKISQFLSKFFDTTYNIKLLVTIVETIEENCPMPRDAVADPINLDTISKIKASFDKHATKSLLSHTQFLKVLEETGLNNYIKFDPSKLFYLFDLDGNKAVDRSELLAGLSIILSNYVTLETRTTFIFHAFDLNGDGVLQRQEFDHMMDHFILPLSSKYGWEDGLKISKEEIFDYFDINKDAVIEINEMLQRIKETEYLQRIFFGIKAHNDMQMPLTNITDYTDVKSLTVNAWTSIAQTATNMITLLQPNSCDSYTAKKSM